MYKFKIEIKWALIFIVVSLIWMFGEKLSGLHDTHIDKHPIFTMFFIIPALTVYILAIKEKRDKFFNGSMTFLQGFITGLIITLIITIITPLTQYLVSTVISPEYFQNAIDYGVETGKMTREEGEDYFSLKNYIIQATISAPMMGIVTSAIVAYILKRK